jgi:2-keto-4-pentenoate hydratase/2-oxohepta-3-ene-1,7-dioic acid hydratase in catechol pathway
MRLVTFEFDGRQHFGIANDDAVTSLSSLALAHGADASFFAGIQRFLSEGERALDAARHLQERANRDWNEWIPISKVHLSCPAPHPSKVVAIGLNYRDHAEEAKLTLPTEPLLFAKFPSSINGPFDPIVIPRANPDVDYEAELAVVIGSRAKKIKAAKAFDFVAGYMVLNDVSARKWQFGDKQWTRGKSCDTFCPAGPWLTTRDEIADPHRLRISAKINGQTVQDSNTNNLIFGVPQLIEHVTESITLEPGDIIATGTPVGVGVFRNPPLFLKDHDTVEISVEGLGSIRNPVIVETS